MIIGIDARFYGSIGKGLGRYTQKLIEYLEDIDTENQYRIFLRHENFEEYQPKNERFQKVLADYRWYSFEEQIGFPLLLYRYHIDVMHFPHFNIPLLYRGKFIVTIHDLILIHFSTKRATTLNSLVYKIKFLAYTQVIKRAILRSSHILTVSEYTRSDILSRYPVAPEKIGVTYEAANPFCFFTDEALVRDILLRYELIDKEGGASSGDRSKYGIIKPYLLYVGNAYPHKNLEALIETVSRESFQDVTLVFVGKEDYFYRRLKVLAEKKNARNIHFVGFVPDRELDVFYRFARAYIFPSLYEGFGLPPLEAMAKGAPVLAAYATALPEILGEAALYFDPGEKGSLEKALREIWENKELRKQLRERGYVRSNQFDWRKMAQQTKEVYHRA